MLTITSAAATGTTATVTCPVLNPNVVSGGYTGIGSNSSMQYTIESYPNASNQWTVSLNNSDSSWTIYAICSK